MHSFIEITTEAGDITLAVSSILFVEASDDNKAVIHVVPEITGTVPFITATETYSQFVTRLP